MKKIINEKSKTNNISFKNQFKIIKEKNKNIINYEKILNSIKDGVYICDIDNNIVFINETLKKIYGKVNNKKCFEYFYGRNEKCTSCNLNKVMAGESIKSEWLSPQDKKNYEIIESPLINNDGSIFKIKILRDISDRKEKNEKIKDMAKFPLENPNPVIRITKQVKILYSNKTGKMLLKHWSYNVGMKIKNKDIKFLNQIYKSKQNKSVEISFKNKYFFLTFIPVLDKDYINIYGFDISERKMLEIENQKKHNIIENITFETKKNPQSLKLFSHLLLSQL